MALFTREYMARTCSTTLGAICSYSYMRRSFPAQRAPCAHTSRASRCAHFPALEAPYSASHPEASIHCPPSSLSAYIPISLICISFHFYFYHGPLLYIPYSVALRLRMTALRHHIYKCQQYLLLRTFRLTELGTHYLPSRI